jgi:uncharacterized membrane protein YedE/YeeE
MQIVIALLCGSVFGLGLVVGQMTNPAKILGFLDLLGLWDPSLAFVMGGAVAVGLVGFNTARKLGYIGRPPDRLDLRLVLGSILFGVGWGLSGFCPGPAIASLTMSREAVVFAIAMLCGMALVRNLAPQFKTTALAAEDA